ncbi:uncharacterized protein OCT59_005332 [Rhizophagus irregularis]|uniref:uncharacterized protein n=1 Tax=Rhizophagus irregularis TaxID=588596 RepID=UPI000CB71192|nr:hypothetical protein OCT59_005332 [Rhizophagus irregularis]GBC20999.1 eukaryotic translation initiation factor 3 subunit [Rhizophagus irregularis DAOM 181602=DAOM 197198]
MKHFATKRKHKLTVNFTKIKVGNKSDSKTDNNDEIISLNEEKKSKNNYISFSEAEAIVKSVVGINNRNKFLKNAVSDSDESDLDKKREIKSAKDKIRCS